MKKENSEDKSIRFASYNIFHGGGANCDISKIAKNITDNNITEASLYVGDYYYSTLYIRSYIIQNGKKIYGKPKKMKYYPYAK